MKQVRAKNIQPGMYLVIGNYNYYVDDIEFTRDGEVLVRIGYDGTGTEFYEMNDFVTVTYEK